MKKQNSKNRSNDLNKINEKDLEKIEEIWRISLKEFPDEALIELEDYPELFKKTKASLKVILGRISEANEHDVEISSGELANRVLGILNYAIREIQISQIKSGEGCKNMYV